MSEPSFTFTIDCGPGTLWKCRVFVWPSKKAMHRDRRRNGGVTDCKCFCRQYGPTDAWKKQLACEMHFNCRDLKRGYVVHESSHAAVAYMKLVKLDINTWEGDETFAATMEHLVCGTLYYLRERKVNVRT